ncbi:MAG: DUF3592 domain-containing protein [Lachnospiraceae bacterium]|nr:DUF3592 domain-containing protein [Lachnospiraceae bacterium]
MGIAGFIIFCLGLIFVIAAPISKKKNARCSEQARGVLKEIFETENSNGNLGHGYIYLYSVNGIEYKLRSTVHSKEASGVGDDCTIWYNPKKPKEAQPFHYDSLKVFNILIIIGIVMVLLGIVLIIFGAAG